MLVKDCGHKHDFCCNIADGKDMSTQISIQIAEVSSQMLAQHSQLSSLKTQLEEQFAAQDARISAQVSTQLEEQFAAQDARISAQVTSQIAEASSQISEERDRIKTEVK